MSYNNDLKTIELALWEASAEEGAINMSMQRSLMTVAQWSGTRSKYVGHGSR